MANISIDKKDLNIPNALSFFRMLLIIPLIYFFSNFNEDNNRIYLIILLAVIAITDNLDGYLARKLNQITDLGKIIDPLSDKIVVAVMAIFMFIYGEIPAFYFWLVLLKNLYIFSGGIYIYKKTGIVPASNIFGKVSVMLLGIFLVWCIIDTVKTSFFYYFLLCLSTGSILVTIVAYGLKGIALLKEGK
jgi:CDP-diacylglycerol--glycerol-3-phosphate 3-phosphatidyltransferase